MRGALYRNRTSANPARAKISEIVIYLRYYYLYAETVGVPISVLSGKSNWATENHAILATETLGNDRSVKIKRLNGNLNFVYFAVCLR